MNIYKTTKVSGIVGIICAAVFAASGVILLLNPDEEDFLILCILLFVFAAIMLILGLVVVVAPKRTVDLTDEKLVFKNFKFEPKESQYVDVLKKTISIPVQDIVNFQVLGSSTKSSFLAGFLGGAIGAALLKNANPDKLIIETKEKQICVFLPQIAGNKIKNSIQIKKESEEMKLDQIEPMKSLDSEE